MIILRTPAQIDAVIDALETMKFENAAEIVMIEAPGGAVGLAEGPLDRDSYLKIIQADGGKG